MPAIGGLDFLCSTAGKESFRSWIQIELKMDYAASFSDGSLSFLSKISLKTEITVCVCVSKTELDRWVQPKSAETGFTGQQLHPSFPR